MTYKEIVVFAVSVIMLSAFSAGLSLDSDSLSDYVEDETEDLEGTVENTTETTTDTVLEEKTVSGILIPTTDSLSTRLETVRDNIPTDAPGNSYFLLSNENTYLVFASESVSVGEYTVIGNRFPSFKLGGKGYATIIADEVGEGNPTNVGLEDLKDNTEDFRYKEVRTSGTLREASVSTDYQTNLASSVSFGFVSTMEPLDKDIVSNLRGRAEKIAKNPSWSVFEEVFGFSESRVPVLDMNKRYWTNSEAEVTGVVLAPEDFLQIKKISGPEIKELIREVKGKGVVYVKDVGYNSRPVDISEIHSIEPGENVQFTGYGSMKSVSMKNVLSSSGIPVPADTVLKAGLISNLDKLEENVIVLGASSRRGQISSASGGKYKVKGKTVSAQTLDSSFPSNRNVVVLHSLEKELEMENVLDEDSKIEDKKDILTEIIKGESVSYETAKKNTQITEDGADKSSKTQETVEQSQKIVEENKESSSKDQSEPDDSVPNQESRPEENKQETSQNDDVQSPNQGQDSGNMISELVYGFSNLLGF
jgi:hypothetical protein